MKPTALRLTSAATLAAASLLGQSVRAANLYWDGLPVASWATASNWSTDSANLTPDPALAPFYGDAVTFNISSVNIATTVNLDANQAASSLIFNNTGTTLIQGNTALTGVVNRYLTIWNGLTSNTGAGAATIGSTTALIGVLPTLGKSQTWTVDSANAVTLVNPLGSFGGASLTKEGTGTLILTYGSGTNNGTNGGAINGPLAVNAGKIQFGADFWVGGLTGNGTIEMATTANRWFFIQNRTDYTFGGTIQNPTGAIGLNKAGRGTQTLTGNVTTANQTTLHGGTLEFGSSSTTGSARTISTAQTGYQFNTGDGTIKSSSDGTGTATLTIGTGGSRSGGASGNFVVSGGTNGTSNSIKLTKAAGFLDQGTYFGGDNYAVMDGLNTFVRSLSYGVDAGAVTSGATTSLASATHQEITGALSAQAAATFTTLKVNGANDITLAGGATLTSNGLLKTGGSASTISGGTALTSAAELVIRTAGAADSLTISTPITGANLVTKSGPGTLTLGAVNTYTNTTTITNGTVNLSGSIATGQISLSDSGILNVTGTINPGNVATSSKILVGTNQGGAAILNVAGGTINATAASPGIIVGNGAQNSVGVVRISSGTVNVATQFNLGNGTYVNNSISGANPYGSLSMTGGTLNSGSWLVVGANADRAILNQSGGTINVLTNRMTIGAGGNASVGVANLTGGTFVDNGGFYVGENGTGTLNISGTANVTAGNVTFGNNASSIFGVVNLLGGTLNTGSITKGASTATGIYQLNLDGANINATAAGTLIAALAGTNVYVRPGNAVINNNGFAVAVAQAILAPTGNGVTAPTVTNGGSGYLDTPVVQVMRGPGDTTGVGATAVATISGGVVTGISITNPGVGYTAAPAFVVEGGGYTTPAVITGVAPVANTSGGVVFSGANATTLTGNSTYTGGTTVSSGTTLALGTGGSAGTIRGIVNVSAGATLSTTATDALGYGLGTVVDTVNVTGGTVNNAAAGNNAYRTNFVLTGGNVTSTGGGALNFTTGFGISSLASSTTSTVSAPIVIRDANSLPLNAALGTTASGVDLELSGIISGPGLGLTKTGSGRANLTAVNTYTGTTTVSAGTLGLGATGSLAAGSSLDVASGGTLDLRNGLGNRAQTVNNLNLNGSTVIFGLGGSSTCSLTSTGTTTISGSNTIKLTGSANTGNYNLISTAAALTGTFVLDTSSLVTGFTTYNAGISGNNYVLTVNAATAPATAYWKGNVSSIWGDASVAPISNWTSDAGGTTDANQIPGATSDVVFSATGAANTSTTLGADFVVKSLTFASGTSALSGSNTITLGGSNGNGNSLEIQNGATANLSLTGLTTSGLTAVQAGGTLNVNGPTTISALIGSGTIAGSSVLTVGTATSSTFAGSFSGSVGLTKVGAGTLSLTGTSSHSGATTVSAGTLSIGNGGTSGSLGSNAIAVSSGATLTLNRSNDLTLANNISGTGTLIHAGSGTTTYTGSDTRTSATTLSAGIFNNAGTINGTTLTLAGGSFQNSTGSLTTPANFTAGSGAGVTGDVLIEGGSVTQTGATGFLIGNNGGTSSYTQTGGTVTTGTAAQGFQLGVGTAGSTGTANLSGGTLNVTNEFWISNNAGNNATFDMSAGAINVGNWITVGRAGATGTLNLSGGTLTKTAGAANYLIVGSLAGTGTLNQTGGALNITAGGIRLGENNGTAPALNSTWSISGNSTATVTGEINVGQRSSHGVWNISGNATVNTTGRLIVAGNFNNAGANGGPVVNGQPVGVVTQTGGTVTFTGGDNRIGGDAADANGAQGTVNVSAGTLNFGGNLQIGAYGTGTMAVSGTGTVNSTAGFPGVGRYAGGNGTLNVSGGTFNQTNVASFLIIGEEGTGTLNLNSGLVDVQELRLGHAATGNGTLNLNGGVLSTKAIQRTNTATGVATVKLNGGTIQSKAAAASLFLDVPAASLSVDQGGASFDTNGFDVTVTQPLTKVAATTGGITKSGAGTLTLSGTGNLTGPVAINGGTLVPGTDTSIGSGAVSVATTGTLNVNGILLTNNVTVAVGGTLAGTGEVNDANVSGNLQPGGANTIGDLTVSGNLTLAEGSTATFELGGSTAALADGVVANDGATIDGQIAVTLVNGYVPALGHSFVLIDNQFGSGMTFSGLNVNTDLSLPALGSGLAWQRSLTSSALTITVVNADPVATYAGTFGLSGNNALPGADPDGDGISNAMEYAFGTSPISNNGPEYRGVASTTSGALTLSYRRPLNGVSGVTYGVEFKTADLVVGNTGWTPGVLNTHYTQSVTPNGDGTTETVTINLIGAVSGKKFARVVVTY